jgi:hypothetical protein
MPAIKRKYWGFYLLGREEPKLRTPDLDADAIAKQILGQDEASLPEQVLAACETAAAKLRSRGASGAWLAEHEEELKQTEADPGEAYQAWCDGRIAHVAAVVEPTVIEALGNQIFEEEP